MNTRGLLRGLLSKVFKTFTLGDIIGKEIGSNKKLYFERSQHLTFLFQRKIKYEEKIQRTIKKYIKEGDLVFDIGANIGQYTLPLCEMAGDSGKVYSFEPDSRTFAFLQFNVTINKCRNVDCLNYAIGGEDTELEFYRDTETGGRMGSFIKKYAGNNYKGASEKVEVRKLDTIIASFGKPAFVKMDVEGSEADVIKALTTDLMNCTFLIEVREETKAVVFNFFTQKRFQCTWIDNNETIITNAEEISGVANLIFRGQSSPSNK